MRTEEGRENADVARLHDDGKPLKNVAIAIALWLPLACAGGAEDTSEPYGELRSASTAACSITAVNCRGRCVQAFLCCIQSGEGAELCGPERDACIEDCTTPPKPPPAECHLPDCPF